MVESNTTTDAIFERWKVLYPDVPPMGHLLRRLCGERWLRVHSLPQGKRYAETDDEKAEMLLRHTTVVQRIFGKGQPIYIILAATFDPDQDEVLRVFGFRSVPEWAKDNSYKEDLHDELEAFTFYVAKAAWNPKDFNELFLRIANDELDPILFVSPESGAVYSPYDGGADLIFDAGEARDKAKEEYSAWLSDRGDGL